MCNSMVNAVKAVAIVIAVFGGAALAGLLVVMAKTASSLFLATMALIAPIAVFGVSIYLVYRWLESKE